MYNWQIEGMTDLKQFYHQLDKAGLGKIKSSNETVNDCYFYMICIK